MCDLFFVQRGDGGGRPPPGGGDGGGEEEGAADGAGEVQEAGGLPQGLQVAWQNKNDLEKLLSNT